MSLNVVTLQGHLGSDPEQHFFSNGGSVTRFNLAVKEYISSSKTEKTVWIGCKGFGRVADSLKNSLTKGREVIIKGKLDVDKYEKDGVKHSVTYVVVEKWYFCGPRKEGESSSASEFDDEVAF